MFIVIIDDALNFGFRSTTGGVFRSHPRLDQRFGQFPARGEGAHGHDGAVVAFNGPFRGIDIRAKINEI